MPAPNDTECVQQLLDQWERDLAAQFDRIVESTSHPPTYRILQERWPNKPGKKRGLNQKRWPNKPGKKRKRKPERP